MKNKETRAASVPSEKERVDSDDTFMADKVAELWAEYIPDGYDDVLSCIKRALTAPDYTEQLRGVIHDIERNVRRFELLGGFNKNGASTQAGATELRAALTTLQSIINEGQ